MSGISSITNTQLLRMYEMRITGHSYRAIADEVGLSECAIGRNLTRAQHYAQSLKVVERSYNGRTYEDVSFKTSHASMGKPHQTSMGAA